MVCFCKEKTFFLCLECARFLRSHSGHEQAPEVPTDSSPHGKDRPLSMSTCIQFFLIRGRCRINSRQDSAGANHQKEARIMNASKTHEDLFCKFENLKLLPWICNVEGFRTNAKKIQSSIMQEVLWLYVFYVCKVTLVMGRKLKLQLWRLLQSVQGTDLCSCLLVFS